ncbi:putative membrane protein [Kibdelosporangium banguiense]|uniref:Membrane protein n=1 Tax=Kibdelosporangium banguiense TaxID=1365924 RepID=A0ABS4U3C1_9PSEU|nr:DUF2269 family protein [Kibdelosporangium banguiense]MBP2331169.1 putative membrane protein [Kibdelosporangium banguiense]
MGARELLLLGHIMFAVIWIGSHIGMLWLGARASREGPARMVQYVADSIWLGGGLQAVSGVLVLLFGGALVVVDGFGFGDLWILLGLIGFVVLLVMGAGYMTPQSRQIIALAEQKGADAAEVRTKIQAVRRVAILQAVLMIAIVLDMIAKPGM